MKWFEGSIPQAITAAKSQNAVFVVYVHDSSDASKTTDEVLGDTDISAALSSNKFVAIRLENGTESALQFSQIYPLVLVPSLFFISGQTGLPLEVLGGPLTKENLKQKLTSLTPAENQGANAVVADENVMRNVSSGPSSQQQQEDKSKLTEDGSAAAAAVQSGASDALSAPDVQESPSSSTSEIQAGEVETQDPGSSEDVGASGITDAEDASTLNDNLTLEDRVERAKNLLAQKQAAQAEEKAQEERKKELERRKMGQEIAKRKMEQEDKDIRAAAAEIKKDKEEDRIARERVKAQIAADRAEREARQALLRGEEPSSSQQARPPAQAFVAASSSNSNTARIKFRLPDGSATIAQFSSETTLNEVRQYIQENINLNFSNFSLTSTVQNRPFTDEDHSRPLSDLGLVPSSILIILPSSKRSASSVVPSGGITDFFWILLSPITFLLGLIRQLFGGSSAPAPSSASSSEEPTPKRAREDGSATTQQRPQTAYGRRGEARLRRDGNIHRLRNDDDDDDDNNTWNGNSTQQM